MAGVQAVIPIAVGAPGPPSASISFYRLSRESYPARSCEPTDVALEIGAPYGPASRLTNRTAPSRRVVGQTGVMRDCVDRGWATTSGLDLMGRGLE